MKTLNITELREVKELISFRMTRTLRKWEHYKAYAVLGRNMPKTKSQIIFFKRGGICLDLLGLEDAELISAIFKKHGKDAAFVLSKSKQFCRLHSSCQELWGLMLKDLETC